MVRSERDPVGRMFEHHQFKFSEHCLTVERSAEHVDKIVHKIRLFRLTFRVGEQIMLKQDLVCGGSDFRNKDLVTGIMIIIGTVGEIGVDRV